MTRLKHKVALITGASRGLGAATARQFVKEGAKVILYTAINNVKENTSDNPESTGKLASSLGIATSSRRKRGFKGSRATARVGVRQGIATRPGKKGPYEYWKPVEFGYHTSRQRWPGESFLVKAFDEKGRQAIKFIVRRLEKAIAIEAKKLDKK